MEMRLAAAEYSEEIEVLQGPADLLNQLHVERGCVPQTKAEGGCRAVERRSRTLLVPGSQEHRGLSPELPVGRHEWAPSISKKPRSGWEVLMKVSEPERGLSGGVRTKPPGNARVYLPDALDVPSGLGQVASVLRVPQYCSRRREHVGRRRVHAPGDRDEPRIPITRPGSSFHQSLQSKQSRARFRFLLPANQRPNAATVTRQP